MKRTFKKTQKELQLKQRLVLVRTAIRDLSPNQLAQINGAGTDPIDCLPDLTRLPDNPS